LLPGETIAVSAFIVPPLAGSVEYQGDRFEFDFSNNLASFEFSAPTFVLPVRAGSSATSCHRSPCRDRRSHPPARCGRSAFELAGSGTATGRFLVFPFDAELPVIIDRWEAFTKQKAKRVEVTA